MILIRFGGANVQRLLYQVTEDFDLKRRVLDRKVLLKGLQLVSPTRSFWYPSTFM